MKSRTARMAVGVFGSVALAAGLLSLASPATQAAEGTLAFIPEEGTGEDGFSVETSGGCASAEATHFIIKMTGAGLKEEVTLTGVTELSAIAATGDQTTAMTAPLGKILETVKGENGGTLPNGGYTISFICRPKLTTTPISTFSGMITVTNGAGGAIAWRSGYTPAPEPIVNTVKPKVTGKKTVGQKLTVSQGKWSPTPSTFAYVWRLDGTTVGTSRSIAVTKAMKGRTLRVTVTAAKSGYANGQVTVRVSIP